MLCFLFGCFFLTNQKIMLSWSRGQGILEDLQALRPRLRTSNCVIEVKNVLEDSISVIVVVYNKIKTFCLTLRLPILQLIATNQPFCLLLSIIIRSPLNYLLLVITDYDFCYVFFTEKYRVIKISFLTFITVIS